MRFLLTKACGLVFFFWALSSVGVAQSGGINTGPAVTADNVTPAPGTGHDYVHLLSETVSPANGSVNIKIDYGAPPSRGISLPAAYLYDSGSVLNLMQDSITSEVVFEQPIVVGQHDLFPVATWSESNYQLPNIIEGTSGMQQVQPACNYASGFTFRGMDGVSHNLPLVVVGTATNDPYGGNGTCSGQGQPASKVTDGVVIASFVSPSATLADVQGWYISSQSNPAPNGPVGAFTVTDTSGTTYFFDGASAKTSAGNFQEYAYQIEDRNGNIISTAGCGSASSVLYCDTSGRPVETASSTGVTVGGVSYTLSNGTAGNATVSYTAPGVQVQPLSGNPNDIGCTALLQS